MCLMATTNESKNAPKGSFAHCVKDDCPLAESCLRHFAYVKVRDSVDSFKVLNPYRLNADGGTCPWFREKKRTRIEWGLGNVFNELPYDKATLAKKKLREAFGDTKYYRLVNETLPLRKKEQEVVQRCFDELGIKGKPKYAKYSMVYQWEGGKNEENQE